MKAKVLVVDNNATQQSVADIKLKGLGYEVILASSYVDASKKMNELGSEKIIGIMTDLFLPNESAAGSEFTQPRGLGLVIRAFLDNIPIVVYTSGEYNESYMDGIVRTLLSHDSDKTKKIPFLTGKSWIYAWGVLNRLLKKEK